LFCSTLRLDLKTGKGQHQGCTSTLTNRGLGKTSVPKRLFNPIVVSSSLFICILILPCERRLYVALTNRGVVKTSVSERLFQSHFISPYLFISSLDLSLWKHGILVHIVVVAQCIKLHSHSCLSANQSWVGSCLSANQS